MAEFVGQQRWEENILVKQKSFLEKLAYKLICVGEARSKT